MKVWNFIHTYLKKHTPTTLLYVLDSQGSSPGREGFMMAVNQQGLFEGTIGGGIMEVKMIELAKAKMEKADKSPLIKKQYHDKIHTRHQSGLICSGEQTILILPLVPSNLQLIETIINSPPPLFLSIDSEQGLQLQPSAQTKSLLIHSAESFEVTIEICPPKTIHIFGAGHVGLALARQMSLLGYTIIQYDDRPNLPTLPQNKYASEIKIIDYGDIKSAMTAQTTDVVVIVTFSYRSDKIALQQLYNQSFAYIGVMGSEHKIATLKKELSAEGISAQALSHVFMPIGLPVYSKTTAEIAVSIAGQIILELNKRL